jgi:hypothetical protein
VSAQREIRGPRRQDRGEDGERVSNQQDEARVRKSPLQLGNNVVVTRRLVQEEAAATTIQGAAVQRRGIGAHRRPVGLLAPVRLEEVGQREMGCLRVVFGAEARGPERVEGVEHEPRLRRGFDLGVGGEDPLEQRRPGARLGDEEDEGPAARSEGRHSRQL